MPLVLEIKRNGERVNPGWDYFALSCVYTAAMKEASPETRINDEFTYGDIPEESWVDWSRCPIYYMAGCPLLEKGRQTLGRDHSFSTLDDSGKRREFKLLKGDELKAYRSSK
jgi:hypothetical protein